MARASHRFSVRIQREREGVFLSVCIMYGNAEVAERAKYIYTCVYNTYLTL